MNDLPCTNSEPPRRYNVLGACYLLRETDGQAVLVMSHKQESRLPVKDKDPVDILKLPLAQFVVPTLDMSNGLRLAALRVFSQVLDDFSVVGQPDVSTRSDVHLEATCMRGYVLLIVQ